MKMISEKMFPDGYDVLNGKAECAEKYEQLEERMERVTGEYSHDYQYGFVPRNNVMDRN